jgi:eukaryotic-like serine/threonine-protein kinase
LQLGFCSQESVVVTGSSQCGSEPTLLRGLTAEQQVQLTEILDDYLRQLEHGQATPRSELLSRYPQLSPELGDALVLYLDKLDELYRVADFQRPLGDLTGKVLGDYRLSQEIGRGGMGIVFTAFDQSLNRQVAVKLLPVAAMLDPKYIERFRGEARAAANLQHPNIVPVYAVGEDCGIHYYAMRLIDGHSLDQRIVAHKQRGTHPPTNSALLQFADIADALHEAHEYGIVHRDIKPSNLLLDDAGKLWVADFGLARFQDSHGLTGTGEMVGTMRYMSPEQAQGRGEMVDHRTDVYSLGATLYEFLSGQQAVPGEEGPGILRTITSQTPIRIRKLRPELPVELQIVLEKAMARHRDDRYATAHEFALDLRKVAYGEPITTRLVSKLVITGRWMAAHSGLVSVLFACIAVLGIGAATAAYKVHLVIAEARDRAIENLRMAHELERQRGTTIDELALIPGVENVRQRMIRSHLKYYQNFAEQAQDDPLMQSDLARAYHRMGAFSEELGRVQEAVGYYQRGESLYALLVNLRQLDSSHGLDRCKNLNSLVLALSKSGRNAQALDLLGKWIDLLREEFSTGKMSAALQLEYALAENNYGLLLRQISNDLQSAQLAFSTAVKVLQSQQTADPENQIAARALAAGKHNLGSLLADGDSSDWTQARKLLEEALSIQQQLARGSAYPLRASADLLATYISLGNLNLQQNLDDAAKHLESAAELARRLVVVSPHVDSYRRDLALALSNLGMACFRSGRHDDALQHLQQSVEQYTGLMPLYPQDASIRSAMAVALNNRGIVLQHVGDTEAAVKDYRLASTLLEAIQPLHAEKRESVLVNLVKLLRKMGRHAEAEAEKQKLTTLLYPREGLYAESGS